MKKFINAVEDITIEALEGLIAVNADILRLSTNHKFVHRVKIDRNKVALISGGGSGHEPLHTGFVGKGMLDAACQGQVFTSPTPDQIIEAARLVGGSPGVLFIVKNYDGDVMNFEMASELLDGKVARVTIDDDVAVLKSTHTTGRRGVAGTLIVEKIIGAAAEEGRDIAALQSLGQRVNRQTRSMGVALGSGIVPAAGRSTFTLKDNEMEMGVGIHGEPGRARVPLASADAIAEEMLDTILADLSLKRGQECLLLVNGFGGTPAMELFIMANAAQKILSSRGLKIARALSGSYVTSLEMAGCSLTVTSLDSETTKLWDAPIHTAALRWGM
jgi:phosphoenolpyruvate---glycerone phosphotransferase subunit DhaK